MPRPQKACRCRRFRGDRVFKPRSIPMSQLDIVGLSLREFEAMRLCDLENLDQTQAGERMGVSRGTVQRLLSRGRAKTTSALLHSRALVVREKGDDDETLYSHGG
jgi:predicted DNA-binding protein (UPF0251 family)